MPASHTMEIAGREIVAYAFFLVQTRTWDEQRQAE